MKTSAVAQYPARRRVRYQNERVRFVDGAEQRYRDCAGPLHEWEIRLDLLDEGELAAVEAFFLANQGCFESFTFTDPWSGRSYENCSLAADRIEMTASGEMRSATSVVVREGRS
jgi:phage-related protein